jgi:hypothetical protein
MTKRDGIAERYQRLKGIVNERSRRLFAAAESLAYGRGGIAAVADAMSIAPSTIVMGLRELRAMEDESTAPLLDPQRIRRPGGGRKKAIETNPELLPALEQLVASSTRGDPMAPLLWTSKSLRHLSKALAEMGHQASVNVVRAGLRTLGYSLQANSKVREGSQHPDRNAQFEHISAEVSRQLANGEPAISVDTKKKELVGDFKNGGREWRPAGDPEKVRVHDFVIPELGRANPYGVYDIAQNNAWVSVGVDHDTAAFAVNTILCWWQEMGCLTYPNATRLLVTADGGGSNGSRLRLWKTELQKLADKIGIPVAVCHLPPGTSKWNKIEHRLFSFITQNWRGKPLITHQVIVDLIAATTTTAGLQVRSRIDPRTYPKGRKISDAELAEVNIKRNSFHGEWNYEIFPMNHHLDRLVS